MVDTYLLKIIQLLPPEIAHKLSLKALDILYKTGVYKFFIEQITQNHTKQVMGINFPNPLGLAAGLDKNAEYISGLSAINFGFLEVGTVTPVGQLGNPRPRLFRIPKYHALINRMGINNKGVDYAIKNISALDNKPVLGINIGKNHDTPNATAIDDYLYCFKKVYTHADYITVNISCPNTSNLTELQNNEFLDDMLTKLKLTQQALAKKHNCYKPLVIKISPDLDNKQLVTIGHAVVEHAIDGIITTNTSIHRHNIPTTVKHATQKGGLSGRPIANISAKSLDVISNIIKNKAAIISCGGIWSEQDVTDRLNAGADLLQLYTAFIYQGISLISKLVNSLHKDNYAKV